MVKNMRESDFAYAVARIRSNEFKLLTGQDIESLLFAESYEQCLSRLADKGWGSADSTESEILAGEQEKMWSLIEEILPECSIFDSLKVQNDYHNLKAALKALIAQTGWEHLCIFPTTVDIEDIKSAVESRKFEQLPPGMAQAAQKAYDALVSWGDGQQCDMIIDAASLEAAIDLAKPVGGVLLEFAEADAFRADVRIAVRCARMKKPQGIVRQALAKCSAIDADKLAEASAQGEEAICDLLAQTDREASDALRKSLKDFEKLCDERVGKRLEYTKYLSLGAEPIVSYIYARQKEMRQVRIILAGLRNSVPVERIRELM